MGPVEVDEVYIDCTIGETFSMSRKLSLGKGEKPFFYVEKNYFS